jgi:probable F420-dependent oxidoreductase
VEIGKLGVWCSTDHFPASEAARLARQVEGWGYGAMWLPESVGRNVMVSSSWLLANTRRLVIASGIASIYARDPMSCNSAAMSLAEQSGGRFMLGLGVSHAPVVTRLRQREYAKPLGAMRNYLSAKSNAVYMAVPPAEVPPTVLAALGPKMIELAGELADGVLTYNATPEHTADARKRLGAEKLLCVELKAVLGTDADKARATARTTLDPYLGLPNYRNAWLRMGFSGKDMEGGSSDRLVDAVTAWGEPDSIRQRVRAHWDAGADHVCIQSLSAGGFGHGDETLLELLAPSPGANETAAS